ncbi:MAG: universal stress protein, partial [Hyphomicrobiales bacterium]|nr:universal stress protein [Hyphomicrobiales bacterium]
AMVSAFFAPVFFALAGLNADLTVLKSPKILALTAALLLAASFGKFLGAFVGGAIGRLTRAESLALAIGMNARGSTEVIVASIGLTTGALTPSLYAMIVAMAALTTCAMPPTLRWALARVPLRLGERERLEREALEARGFVTNMERFLVLADDQRNGRLASRVGGLLTGARGQPVTALHVESPPSGRDPDATRAPAIASDLREGVDLARLALRDNSIGSRQLAFKAVGETKTFETAVSEEARKGHDFLIIGLDPGNARQGGFAAEIASAVRSFSGPAAVAIARGVHERDPARNPLNIVVPVTGDANARHAAEVAIELARVCGGELTIFSISSAGGRQLPDSRRRALASRHNQAALKEIVEIADKRGQRVRVRNRSGGALSDVILSEAELAQATLIVFGASVRPSEALLFGETANELLEESPRSLLFVAS